MSTNNNEGSLGDLNEMYRLIKPFLGYKAMRFDAFYNVRKSNVKGESCQAEYLSKVYNFFSERKNCEAMEKKYNIGFDAKEFLQYLYLDYVENQCSDMLDQEALEFIETVIGYNIKIKEEGKLDKLDNDFRNDLKTIFRSSRLNRNIEDIKAKNDAVGVYATVDNKSYLMASVSNLIKCYKIKFNLSNDDVAVLYERVLLETRINFWKHFWGFWSLNILLSFATVSAMVGFVFALIPLPAPLAFLLTIFVCIAINYWIDYVRYPKDWSWKNLKTYRPALDYFKSETFKRNIGLELEKADNRVEVEEIKEGQYPQISDNISNQGQNNFQDNGGNQQEEVSKPSKPVVAWVQKTNSKLKYKLLVNICWSVFKVVCVFAVVFLAFNFIPGAITFLSGVKTFASVNPVLLAKIVEIGSYILSGLTILLGAGAFIGKGYYSNLKNDKIVVDSRNHKRENALSVFGIEPENVKPMLSRDNSSIRTTANTMIEHNNQ